METQKSALFTRDFTLVVIGQIISLFGNAILHFALPLYLLRETGSITLFGVVNACSFLPMILMGPIGGTAADRVHKGRIMVGLDFLTAGLTVAYTLLWGKAPLVPLVIGTLMLLYAIAGAYQPAVQASLPLLLAPDRLTQGSITLDVAERAAWRDGMRVDLTAKEYDLIELLMRNPRRVYSRENLMNVVWGYSYAGDYRTVDVHIRRLREKLEENPAEPDHIMTKWGVGYYFKE